MKNLIVRGNLMDREGYTPYCGSELCEERTPSSPDRWPRTYFDGNQFVCPKCKWISGFPSDFIDKYKRKWNLMVQKAGITDAAMKSILPIGDEFGAFVSEDRVNSIENIREVMKNVKPLPPGAKVGCLVTCGTLGKGVIEKILEDPEKHINEH